MADTIDEMKAAHLAVTCWTCGVGPDERCVTKSGKSRNIPHVTRIRAGNHHYMDSLRGKES